MANVLNVIHPYKWQGMWVFDDQRVDLEKEPFIEGADTLIDRAVESKGIAEAEKGFRLIFSASVFPNYDLKFEWLREGDGGNWYYSPDYDMQGWLCRALLKYFDEPPKQIFARFEEKSKPDS